MNRSDNSNLYYYQFYGVNLQINRLLPEFDQSQKLERSDIKVSLTSNSSIEDKQLLEQKFNWQPLAECDPNLDCYLSKALLEGASYYQIRHVFKQEFIEYIFNSDGSEIWGVYSSEALFQDAISLLLGYVLGTVIRLRGNLAFHASAIAINKRVILLTGDSGAGKSTTAAALSKRGFPVLADDIAVLKLEQGQYWVQPGYPRLRLCPQSVKAFDTSPQELTKVSSFGYKRYLNLAVDNTEKWLFQPVPLPLAGIYIMGKREQQLARSSVKSLASSQAMTKLVKSVYGSYFLNKDIRTNEFQQLAQFVRTVPIRQLSRPNNLSNLDQLCCLIVDDYDALNPEV